MFLRIVISTLAPVMLKMENNGRTQWQSVGEYGYEMNRAQICFRVCNNLTQS